MWPFKPKEKQEVHKAYLMQWDDSITAKEVMELFMWYVSNGGIPAAYLKPSQIPAHLEKFFKEKE